MERSISTKGQVWYLDFIIGGLIFMAALVVFFLEADTLETSDTNGATSLLGNAVSISSELLTPGTPQNWTAATVERIGVTNSYRLDLAKLSEFKSVDYQTARSLFRTTKEFFMFIERQGCLVDIDGAYGIGHPAVTVPGGGCVTRSAIDLSDADVENLVVLTRLVIYDGTPARLNLYVWE
ncbi:hypothetical protein HY493_01200 [Candidatus Woesearchaeota archaeon]|nr:hypothetical protein [Candidatus Woesearchaeota archaeon]